MAELDSVSVALRASLKPADYENLSAEVRINTHIPPAEVYGNLSLPVPSTRKDREKAFATLKEELLLELQREIINVFNAAGYEPPIHDPEEE